MSEPHTTFESIAGIDGQSTTTPDSVEGHFDGACRGNPGPAAIGYHIDDPQGGGIEESEPLAETTNNRAEYAALIRLLETALDVGYSTINVYGDSKLVVEQVVGDWDANDSALAVARDRALSLLDEFDDWSLSYVPRSENARADRLADEALDD